MRAIAYRNTTTNVHQGFPPADIHVGQPRGVAYESPTHFIHYYGKASGLYPLSVGLKVTEHKSGTLEDWVTRRFGAADIRQLKYPAGSSVKGVWRPGVYYHKDSLQALGNTEADQRSAEQALRLLVERLDELLLYVEPNTHGLQSYSHKSRELLILACTEVENSWKYYMRQAGAAPANGRDFNTNDYVRLLPALHLSEYQVTWTPYASVPPIAPFNSWIAAQPTQSLPWYNAYNKTKHDRSTNFGEATLANCLASVAANIAMFAVRFGPHTLLEGTGTLPSSINNLCRIELQTFDLGSYYTPSIRPNALRPDLSYGGGLDVIETRNVLPFTI
jgi:hypothetical protein